MKKAVAVLFILLILVPRSVLSDGGVWHYYDDQWTPLEENAQVAVINYQDGLQKMIIAVNFDESESDAVWIFPVPAEPNSIAIDIVERIPFLQGTDPTKTAKNSITTSLLISTATQIYPTFLLLPFYLFGWYGAGTFLGGAMKGMESRVTVYEHIEKEGIVTELVTSETGDALYNYLSDKALGIKRETISIFDDYIGKEYSFVVSWVSEERTTTTTTLPERYYPGYPEYYQGRQPGVFITFPTDKIYYPLLPTSVYGSTAIPINIYILDYVKPKTYSSIRSYVDTNYYLSGYVSKEGLESFFGSGNSNNLKYTKVEIIDAPSKYFTKDMWFDRGAPIKVGLASLINSYFNSQPLIAIVSVALFMSALTGAVSGLILFGNWKKYALIGLANIFSIIGLTIAVFASRSDKKIDERFKRDLKRQGFVTVDARKYKFIPLYSIMFLVLCFFVYIFFNLIL